MGAGVAVEGEVSQRVVHDRGDRTAKAIGGLSDEGIDLGAVADISPDRDRLSGVGGGEVLRGVLGGVVVDDHSRTLGQERASDRSSESAGAAGDEDDLLGEGENSVCHVYASRYRGEGNPCAPKSESCSSVR